MELYKSNVSFYARKLPELIKTYEKLQYDLGLTKLVSQQDGTATSKKEKEGGKKKSKKDAKKEVHYDAGIEE